MNDLRFFFYDTETTGLVEFDQILQIAAVITDQNFNVLETINLSVIKDYVVPSHRALTTTGVIPTELYKPELTEYKLALNLETSSQNGLHFWGTIL